MLCYGYGVVNKAKIKAGVKPGIFFSEKLKGTVRATFSLPIIVRGVFTLPFLRLVKVNSKEVGL